MTSTLIAPAFDATIHDAAEESRRSVDDVRPKLFDTMRAIVEHRRRYHEVPVHLLDDLRVYQLVGLADAIERYNERVTRVRVIA